MIRVCKLDAQGEVSFPEVADTPEAMWEILGGYMEAIGLPPAFADQGLIALVDEEGNLKKLPPNPHSWRLGHEVLVGPVIIVRTEPPQFVSLTDSDVVALSELLG